MKRVVSNTSSGAKRFGPADYIKISIFGFAMSALWGSLHTIVIQVRLLDFGFTGPEKTFWLGLLTLVGLVVAMIVQPIAGAISDRSGFRWGRRRPYILIGTILTMLFLPGLGFSGSYLTLFITYCLLQVSSNIAQGPYQGFIPDLVPKGKRGLGSGVKTLLEFAGGIALAWLVFYFMERYVTEQGDFWLWLLLAMLATVLLGVMVTTIVMVKERPGGGSQLPLLPTLYKSFKIDVKASPDFIRFLISRLLVLTAWVTLQRYALFFLMDVIGIVNPLTVRNDLLIVVGACMLAAAYPAGRLSDRVGRRPIAVASGLLGALGVIVLFFSHSYGPVMFASALLGISGGAFMSANWALATDLLPRGEEAKYLGLTNLATAGSGALVGLMGLVIYFCNVDIPGLGYQVMFGACFIYFLVGAALLMKIEG